LSARLAGLAFALLLALTGCGAGADQTPTSAGEPGPASSDAGFPTISDRAGPSWRGHLGDTVRIDWHGQTGDTVTSELVTVLDVKLVATSDGAGPRGSGSTVSAAKASGYDWRYAITVKLESLDERAARRPIAYQFLMLSDGRVTQDGIGGLAGKGGPNPSTPGRSSTGVLSQWTEEGFRPTEVVLPVGIWQASWSLSE
jgi:hypothetical protein